MLTLLAASLAAAASRLDGSSRLQEVVPTTPWSAPVATAPAVSGRASSAAFPESSWRPKPASSAPAPAIPDDLAAPAKPASAEPATPAVRTDGPAVDVLEPLRNEPSTNPPQRLYLERLLIGETVDGWVWDPGEDAEALSAELDRSSDTRRLSLGFEHRTERTVFKNKEGEYEDASLIGPRMRWRPTEHTHFDLAPLVGVNTPYPMSEVVLVFGWKY